jgi:putative glutamine amidotransferase
VIGRIVTSPTTATNVRTTPKVAVLVAHEPADRVSVHRGYVDALVAVGAAPVLLTAVSPPMRDDVLALACECDGVMITGGADVDPACYGEEVVNAYGIDPVRDAFEIAAVHAARAAGVRVLGICRGAQLVNVALGGTLHQDLPTAGFDGHWEHERQYEAVHGIEAVPGTLTETVLGGSTTVNSIHHQAIKAPAPGVVVGACSTDGVIEAIETDGVLALQWHPERLFGADPAQLRPFAWVAYGSVDGGAR